MRYALVENGKVVNVIELAPKNAHEFPNAVLAEDYSVVIDDVYVEEENAFYHEGNKVLSKDDIISILQQALTDVFGDPVNINDLL